MDIDLFSDIVKDLILDNDEVTLPGLGTFVSELMPSTFSDKGYTILTAVFLSASAGGRMTVCSPISIPGRTGSTSPRRLGL